MFYAQKNYGDKIGNGPLTIAQSGCFLTAFCNLFQRFGKTIDPPSLNRLYIDRGAFIADPGDGARDELGWSSATAYDGQIKIDQRGGSGWPNSNNSIVEFRFVSPYSHEEETHFCLVADYQTHLIVDSFDGAVKPVGYYGEPVAWCSYTDVVAIPVIAGPPQPTSNPSPDGQTVIMKAGDTISAIALKYGFTAQELLDHNGLSWDAAQHLPVGYAVHLPSKASAPVQQAVQYEAIPARQMHTNKDTQKWGFGNVKHWSDFISNGPVAVNTNVTAVGVAKVLVDNEVAAYYMDAVNFGNYTTNGTVVNTIGYNWSDLSDGWYEAPELQPEADTYTVQKGDSLWEISSKLLNTNNTADIKAKVQELSTINNLLDPRLIQPGQVLQLKAPPPPPPAPEPVAIVEAPKPAPVLSPNEYKTTYQVFPESKLYCANNTIMCKEYDSRRPDHQLIKNKAVSIAGTFIKDGVLYGRPTGAVKYGYWFGVPMDQLTSEEELLNAEVDLPTKVLMHQALTLGEHFLVMISYIRGLLLKLTKSKKA